MRRLAEFVLRHRRLIGAAWLVAFLAGVLAAPQATKRFSTTFSLPGQPGARTAAAVLRTFGNGGENSPLVLVATVPPGHRIDDAVPALSALETRLATAAPRARVITYADTHDRSMVTSDGRTAYGYVFTPRPTGFADTAASRVRDAAAAASTPALTITATGYNQLESGSASHNKGPGVLQETLLGGLGALAVLAFVFASFLAILPLVIAAVSILTTFLILLGLTYVADISFIVQFLVSLIGLGVAIDYSLIIVSRWREERAHGRSNHDAVVVAVETAGHAVVFSGVTVAIGLFALVVLPVPFLRSMGFGGMLIPLVSTLVSLTLLPAVLGGIGPRLDWPRIRQEDTASRSWVRWARLIVRQRWLAAGVALAGLVTLVLPLLGIRVGLADSASLASQGPAYTALHQLTDHGIGTGVLTPIEVLAPAGQAPAVAAAARSAGPAVATVLTATSSAWQRDGRQLLEVVPTAETVAGPSTAIVNRVRAAVLTVPGVVGVTGVGALQRDYLSAVYGNFPIVLAVLAVLTYILLVRAFRSLLLPAKAVVLNLVSVSATFGAMVWFWQFGHGSQAVFGVRPTGAITFWLPILVFAFLFGLSMDYEVFILARMREEYDATGNTGEAVVEGLGRTGRLVTSAALILFLSFVSLASSPGTDIKVFATGLGVGILLDATVVRALLVPALVSLFGSWNWYLPAGMARLLRVAPATPRTRVGLGAEPAAVD